MLSWDEYVRNGTVRKAEVNKGLIKSLIKMSDSRINIFSRIKVDRNNSSILFTNYYDSLREICEAIALLNGYKIYSHEALGLFLKNTLKEDALFIKFDKFRIMRNGVNYYGKQISFEEAKNGIDGINELIKKLKVKYMREFL